MTERVEETFEEKKARLVSVVKLRLKRAVKLVRAIKGDREKLSAFERGKTWGDACQSNFSLLKRGMSEISLQNQVTGDFEKIPLSPELGPAENVAELYKRHRKYRTGMVKTAENLALASKKEEREREFLLALEQTTNMEELEAVGVEEDAPRKRVEPRKKGEKSFSKYRMFESKHGFEMVVGRNDEQNDDLVRHSNGNDLWFHVRDFPGSHVVVRVMKKKEVPFDTILEAARLALKFSSRAKDMKGTVVYTHVKHLRRPKGAPPGRVLVTKEKTVMVAL